MKNQSSFKSVMSTVALFLSVSVVTYGFLTLVNWTPNIGEWNGFSRFIIGVIGVVFVFKIFDELS